MNQHPEIKNRLKKELENLSGTAFSLQQLLFNLDSAFLETVPTFNGIPKGSNAEYVLQKTFVSNYSAYAKKNGLPMVAVAAVSHPSDPSPLKLTSLEREVCPLLDPRGNSITNPTNLQKSVSTLNYLCAVDGHILASPRRFAWNWVQPDQINDISGMIAIKRNTFAQYLLDQLKEQAENCCMLATCHMHFSDKIDSFSCYFHGGQKPDVATVTSDGQNVINIKYSSTGYGKDDCAQWGQGVSPGWDNRSLCGQWIDALPLRCRLAKGKHTTDCYRDR